MFLVTVDRGASDAPPVISPIADQALVAGATLSLQASASDPAGDAVRFGLAAAPAGMTINPTTGAIHWIPGAGQAGQTTVTVSAADPGGQSAETGFTVTVRAEAANNLPTIAPVDDQSVNIGEAVRITLSASDGALDSNVASVDITLSIVNAPQIASSPLTGASPGFAYQYGALATDADFGDTFTWTLVDAPAGMTVDAQGIVSWQPQASDLGTQRVNLIVTDADGNTDSQSFTINVAPPVIVPDLAGNDAAGAAATLEAAGLVSGNVTESFSLTVPTGEVLSQSVAAGSSSAAGAFVDYVISLGPPPIFVPALANLSVSVAEAALLDFGLALGNVTYVNDVNVPRNLVVTQSIGEGTNVAAGTSVDIVVSGGPALSLRLAQTLIGNGEGIEIDIQAFDVTGNPLALPADLAVSVVAGGDASGTLPTVSGNQLQTGADTQGGYTLSVASDTLGLDVSEAFLVSSFFNGGELQGAYGPSPANCSRPTP